MSLVSVTSMVLNTASDGAATPRIKPSKSGTKAKWLIGNEESVPTNIPCLSGGAVHAADGPQASEPITAAETTRSLEAGCLGIQSEGLASEWTRPP